MFLLISFPILNDEYIDWSKLTEQENHLNIEFL